MRKLIALSAVFLWAHGAAADTFVTNLAVNASIPDNNAAGLVSAVTLPAGWAEITGVRVGLQIAGEHNGDLYAYLSHGTNIAILLNRPGRSAARMWGYGDKGLDVTLADGAANGDIHAYRLAVSGSHTNPLPGPLAGAWAPDGRENDPATVLDTDTRASSLARFIGAQPDGVWTLFVADFAPLAAHTLIGWRLEINTLNTNEIVPPSDVVTNADPGQCFAANVALGAPTIPFAHTTLSNNAPAQFMIGATPVIWTAVKPGGEIISATQQVTVLDTQAPTLAPPADVSLNVFSLPASNVNLGSPIAGDNCAVASITNNAPPAFPGGLTHVVWTVTDASGNSVSATQRVSIVLDNPATQHPRLFFFPDAIAGFRAKANQAPWSNMLAAVEWGLTNDLSYQHRPGAYATLHLFQGDGPAPRNWSEKAMISTLEHISDTAIWANNGYSALSRSGRGLHVAMAYDLCHSAWAGRVVPPVFTNHSGAEVAVPAPYAGMDLRAAVSLALKANADSLISSGGSGWPGDGKYANNWYGVRYAGAGLSYLACDEPPTAAITNNLNTAINMVKIYKQNGLGAGLAGRGWNVEGIAYSQYPGWFVYPFAHALKRLRGRDLPAEVPMMTYELWANYQGVLPIERVSRLGAPGDPRLGWGLGLRPDFNDDHDSWDGEGTAALAFAFSPPEFLPGLKWQFRRLCGDLGDQTWDASSGNGLWSLLFYPNDLAERNPAEVWGLPYADMSYGMFVFRNRFQDRNDFVFQTTAKLRQNLGGHNGADGLGLRLWGLNVPWMTGSGRTSDPRGQTTVFPGPPEETATPVTPVDTALLDLFQRSGGDGYAVMRMGTSDTGVGNHTRRIVVDYGTNSGAAAVLVVSDSSDDGRYWRLNTPWFNTITTGANRFTITSLEGHQLNATILWPTNAALRTGKFTRGSGFKYKDIGYFGGTGHTAYADTNNWVDFASADGHFVVVMTVTEAGATPPTVSASGMGVQQTIGIGDCSIVLDGNQISVGGWTRPGLTVLSPPGGANFNSGATNITVSGYATDPDGLAKVEIYLDSVFAGSVGLSGNSNAWSLTLTNVGVGPHTIEIRAVDALGDDSSARLTVQVNLTIPPWVTLDSPSFGSALWSGQNVTLFGRAADPEGALSRVEIWADGAKLGNATLSGGVWKYTWNAVKTGKHSVYALAFDSAGDFAHSGELTLVAGVQFSAIPKWGDAANYFVGGAFDQVQPQLNGAGRWSVVEEDGDLRLKVRPEKNYDYNARLVWFDGSDVIGNGNWRLTYLFKTGAPLSANPESFVHFGRGTDAEMTLDLRPSNGVKASHPNYESGTRVWHRLNSGPLTGVAWSFNPATYPDAPDTDYAGIPNEGWNQVRVDRIGKNLKVWVNQRLILDATHSFLGTKGRVGFGNWRPYGSGGAAGFFDDVLFLPLDADGNPTDLGPAAVAFAPPSPEPHGHLAGGSTVEFAAQVADPDGVAGVEFFLGAERLGSAAFSNGLWRLAWTSASGVYAVSARVTDAAGNVSYAGALPFRVSASGGAPNTRPALTITRDTNSTLLRFTGTVADPDGAIAQVQLVRDGLPVGIATVTGGAWNFTYSNAPAGLHLYCARAMDDLGAIGTSQVILHPAPSGGALVSPPLHAATAPLMVNGDAYLLFLGAPGRSYQLLRSADLQTWLPLATNTAPDFGLMLFMDAQAPLARGFYRLVSPE